MTFILTDGPPPENKTGSPLENVFDYAFPLADKLSFFVNESAEEMVKNDPDFSNMGDVIVAHSVALMLIICMMNRNILETKDLNITFEKVKHITQDYLKHILEMGRSAN